MPTTLLLTTILFSHLSVGAASDQFSSLTALFSSRRASQTSAVASLRPRSSADALDATQRVRLLVREIVAGSYPELRTVRIEVKPFSSQSDYFKARFALPQFFSGRMRYLLFVNPRVFETGAPAEGVRAIIAHELGHILYFQKRNRLQLTGLVRLASKRFTARFERWADLTAISLGYADGLKEYRNWLYRHVPPTKLNEKRRNYFSPEEIDAILSATRRRPELLEYWLGRVPLSLSDIRATS